MPDWNSRYRRGEHAVLHPLPLLVEMEAVIANAAGVRGRALDLACGPGRHALFLAERGWTVVAVDASQVAIDMLRESAAERGLSVDARVEDIEGGEFRIERDAYDLILDCCYLYRPLFRSIRGGIRPGGIFFGAIPIATNTPGVPPMNPAFVLDPGELETEFAGWKLFHSSETPDKVQRNTRPLAEIIAQRIAGS